MTNQITNPVLRQIWEDRYRKNNESLEDNYRRVAKYIAKNKNEEELFYEVISNALFLPAGRTMSNSGIGRDLTLNNCFTAPQIQDSLDDIFEKVRLGAKTHQKGGGIGYDFSQLRPKGSPTSNDAIASGAISFMDVFNTQTSTILQGGRRGANMGVMNIYSMDIEDFISAKSYEESKLNHFNVSVMVDNDFMKALENDDIINLHYPVYDEDGKILKDETKWIYRKEIKASYLWDLIMRKAYDNGEPGIFFYENMNNDNNLWYIENIVTSNPCAEYLAGTIYGNNPNTGEKLNKSDFGGACNLGSLFLQNFVENPFTKIASTNKEKLTKAIHIAVRMLDNIIDINNFPDKIYENYQKSFRTIGIGYTGLADMLVMMNMTYGSDESIKYVDELNNLITKEVYKASVELAKEKSEFPLLNREKFVQSGFIQKHIEIDSEWKQIYDDILKYGIRNSKMMSVAPTGTLSLTFGNNCSSGLEPIFSLEYDRKVKIGGQSDDNIQIVKMRDYAYEKWLGFKDNKDCIVSKDKFVTALNLSVDEHLKMLKTIAFHTDMSCSKTINIPTEYSFEDTKKVYEYCFKNGVKGCTIFRPNEIRQGVLISPTTETKKEEIKEIVRGDWEELSDDIVYYPKKIYIGCGKIKLFIGWSEKLQKIQDLYVVRSGNGGCEKNLQSTVIAMSGMLRLGGNIFNIEKAFEGLGGCNSFVSKRSKGDKLSKGSSCGTAMLNAIKEFMDEITSVEKSEISHEKPKAKPITLELPKIEVKKEENKPIFNDVELEYLKQYGEISFAQNLKKCPLCGEHLEYNGGCLTCNSCGWSKCE